MCCNKCEFLNKEIRKISKLFQNLVVILHLLSPFYER